MPERWRKSGAWAACVVLGVLASTATGWTDESAAAGKLVSDVIIHGNVRTSTEQIKKRWHVQVGQEYKPAVVDDDVRDLYTTHQFSNIATFLQAEGTDKVKIYFIVREMPNLVQKVTFLGAKHVKQDELRSLTGVKPGDPLNPNLNLLGCRRILDKYEELGRSFAHCTLIKGGNPADDEVIYQITEGPLLKVGDVKFEGNTFVSSARLATILKSKQWFARVGGTYSKAMADADTSTLTDYYHSHGYRDVRISLETVRSNDGGPVTLIYHIREGSRSKASDKTTSRDELTFIDVSGHGESVTITPIKVHYEVVEQPAKHAGQASKRCTSNTINKREERPPARISQIHITGNQHVSSESILAHLPLLPGQILDYCQLQYAEKILADLELFVVDADAGVRPTITVIDSESPSGYKDLLITVQEKSEANGKQDQPR